MRYSELSEELKEEAIEWALDDIQELYDRNDIDHEVTEESESVKELYTLRDYGIIEEYIDGVKHEHLCLAGD